MGSFVAEIMYYLHKNRDFRLSLRYELTSFRRAGMMGGTPKVVAKWRLIAAIGHSQWYRVAS